MSRPKERTAVARCSPRSDGLWLVVSLDGRSIVADREMAPGEPLFIPINKQGGRG